MAWSDIVLFYESDLDLYEKEICELIDGGIERYRDVAKEEIESRLWVHFRDLNPYTFAMTDDLDCIRNPETLKRCAIFYALYLIFIDLVKPNDEYNSWKAGLYKDRYDQEFNRVLPSLITEDPYLHISGQQEESENFGYFVRW